MADNPLDTPIAPPIEVFQCRQAELTPAFLNMEDVDLEQAAGVVATSPFIDVRTFFNFKVFCTTTQSGGSAGTWKLTLEEFLPSQISSASDEPTPVDSEDIITAIASDESGTDVLFFGATVTPNVYSAKTTPGTVGSNLARFALAFVVRFKLEITLQGVATSSLGSVYIALGD